MQMHDQGESQAEDSEMVQDQKIGLIRDLISNKLCKEIEMLDFNFIQVDKANIYAPRTLLNLCLGHLKLAELDPSLMDYLMDEISDITKGAKRIQESKS